VCIVEEDNSDCDADTASREWERKRGNLTEDVRDEKGKAAIYIVTAKRKHKRHQQEDARMQQKISTGSARRSNTRSRSHHRARSFSTRRRVASRSRHTSRFPSVPRSQVPSHRERNRERSPRRETSPAPSSAAGSTHPTPSKVLNSLNSAKSDADQSEFGGTESKSIGG